ncbi:C25 family cysteine peptidase [Dyadobacter sp. CY326]|uniref:putative type IX secretion system sortase PorU2 n=1 Tax=Dyadobacter sp. CY326 TaxID=2907300 RepID=UPI001F241CA0|nr:C25 family cysteine peptidase [Dyadobacter sp. CY326]MCE7065319.1 C25 family cysteine peptidase [Dyadobacter sp. CY326]
MRFKNSTLLLKHILLYIILLQGGSSAFAQKWSGVNGNEWLQGKYGQKWVRIGVNAKGIHKIAISALPADFQNADKARLQLWHRGNEVSLIKADASEILFYGVPNDGASDELLYRLPSSRKNPYFSTFSDESAYFLTIGSSNGARAVVENTPVDNGIAALTSHIKTELKTYQNEYTHTTLYSLRPTTLNSYFEEGKTGTGSRIPIPTSLNTTHTSNPKPINYTNNYVPEPFTFNVKNLLAGSVPNVKVLLSGRYGSAQAEIFVGKTPSTLRAVTSVFTSEFAPLEVNFPLTSADFVDGTGGTFGFRATVAQNFFSVSYFTVTYNQAIDMQGLNSYEFNFPAVSANSKSRIPITTPAAASLFYDISKVDQPRIIQGSAANLMVTRDDGPLKLLATNETVLVADGKISTVEFKETTPSNFDYLIVTNETLANAGKLFADYRESESPGKRYKPLVKKIKDIYNEFNYGEPSPVAIRRFVDYMISDNNKEKYLLLIGKSVTRPDKVVKELNNEVPTIGFPGSDILLVDGLKGTPEDVPTIPVGRISAITEKHVTDYLDKIKTYESQKDLLWRKNVMHLSGGKDQLEINQFSGYLSAIGSAVTNAPFQGVILKKIKSIPQDVQEQISISTELNGEGAVKGLGMVSYFGHGSTYRTDLNAGYATDAAKGYNNTGKYPVLFYNGCGVGNVFSDLFDESVNLSSSRPMSLDWLLAPAKGAIVVFGNDWDAYASVSNEYLDRLYPLIFSKNDSQRGTIGQILREVAAQTKIAKGYTYNPVQNGRVAAYYDADRANIHQVLLQGDPALRVLLNEGALPVDLISFDAKVNGVDNVEVTWKTASEKNNSHFVVERSYNARNFESIGRVEGKGDSNSEHAYSFIDSNPLDGTSYYRLTQVDLDEIVGGQTKPGISTASSIVSVTRNNTSTLSVSPNPTADFVDIDLKAPVAIKFWNLINASGKVLRRNEVGKRVSLLNLSAGEYLIEITTVNGDKYTKKVIKY